MQRDWTPSTVNVSLMISQFRYCFSFHKSFQVANNGRLRARPHRERFLLSSRWLRSNLDASEMLKIVTVSGAVYFFLALIGVVNTKQPRVANGSEIGRSFPHFNFEMATLLNLKRFLILTRNVRGINLHWNDWACDKDDVPKLLVKNNISLIEFD